MKRFFTLENLFWVAVAGWCGAILLNAYVALKAPAVNPTPTKVVAPVAKTAQDIETERCMKQMRRDLRIIRHDLHHIEEMLEEEDKP